jgi:2-polyprenyl-6-methoxyphenol hydroxylase-like FAD-dependent oxidoreductase
LSIDWNKEHSSGFLLRISLDQPDIENAMDAMARKHAAEINQGWEVTSLTRDGEAVFVTVRKQGSDGSRIGPERAVRTKYQIASDGARSATRQALGIDRESWHFRDAWLLKADLE